MNEDSFDWNSCSFYWLFVTRVKLPLHQSMVTNNFASTGDLIKHIEYFRWQRTIILPSNHMLFKFSNLWSHNTHVFAFSLAAKFARRFENKRLCYWCRSQGECKKRLQTRQKFVKVVINVSRSTENSVSNLHLKTRNLSSKNL